VIEYQLFVWISLSVISGLLTYFILTRGESTYMFVMSLVFGLLFGTATSYIWLLTTNGLMMYSWGIVFLPCLLTCVAEIFLLSYYKAHHDRAVFPRVPMFSVGRASFAGALAAVAVLSFLLASSYMLDGGTAPAVSTLSSSGTSILSTDDAYDPSVCLSCIGSSDIKIQGCVVGPTILRNDPLQGEYFNFRAEFDPAVPYTSPSLTVFVHDSDNNLIPANTLFTTASGGTVTGQVYCDTAGTFTITVLAYDLAVSGTYPLAANTHSYTVQGALARAPVLQTFHYIAILVFVLLAMLVVIVAMGRRFLKRRR